MTSFLEILIIFLLILVNGLFTMAELAIIAVRKLRLQQRVEGRDKRATEVLRLANNVSNFLSTIQIWITLIGILAEAFGSATIAERIRQQFQQVPRLQPYGKTIGVIVVVLVTTWGLFPN